MDNYYKGTSYMQKVKEKEGIILNYDQPEVIDIALLQQQL
jgi:uridine kinase